MYLPGALVVREPKYLVFPNWPTRGVAKLIAAQFGLARREVIRCVELVVTEKLEYVAVKAVGARLGDGVHDGAAEFTVFGIEAVGYQPEFLNRIEIWNHARAQVAALAHVAAVY